MLLILAGVSISLVVGDNGVLTQAKTSSDKTKVSQFKEALGLAINDVQTAYFANYANKATTTFDSEINLGTIDVALQKQGFKLKDGENSDLSDTTPAYVEVTSKTNPTDFLAVKISKSSASGVGVTTVFAKEMNKESASSIEWDE